MIRAAAVLVTIPTIIFVLTSQLRTVAGPAAGAVTG
jgi:ABC-type glycerol-3-phosphate transport system permease component